VRVLVIGGSGTVGGLTLPVLADSNDVEVLDPRPPAPGPWRHVEGSVEDDVALRASLAGKDAMLYMAMGPQPGWGELDNAKRHFDISVRDLYVALRLAHEAGVQHAVVTSSMSVYVEPQLRTPPEQLFPTEDVPADAHDFYGLTKRLGEEVCRAAVAEYRMSVVSLRLCLPTSDEIWNQPDAELHLAATSGTDTGRALALALAWRGHGFEQITISGDSTRQLVDIQKAARLLSWSPLGQQPITRR